MLPHIQAFTSEAFHHYENATDDGKAYFDDWLSRFYEMWEVLLQQAPDDASVRKMKRQVAIARKKHHEAKKFIQYFPTILDEEAPLTTEAATVLGNTLQCLLDILHDAMQKSMEGPAGIAILGLLYSLFDELTVAQYLARKNYSTLAYTHLRSVMEILDKIELFTKQPEEADIWASGNEHEVWKKLSPPRVREKLGRSNLDHVYRYFSEQGAHATFTATRQRLRLTKDESKEPREIAIKLGGVKDRVRQTSVLIYCIQLAGNGIVKAQSAFTDRLDDVDITEMVTKLTNETNIFYGHFLDRFDRSNVDMEPLEIVISVLQKMRDRGEI